MFKKHYASILKNLEIQKQTKARSSLITPDLLGKTIQVYNGKAYPIVFLNSIKLGTKLGSYSFTRGFGGHLRKKKKKK